MPVPDFQSIMLPLLQYMADGAEHPNQETLESLAQHFQLTEEDRAILLPSGRQPLFVNRLAWAKFHLKGAGLLESPRRGVYQITNRGHEVLKERPAKITIAYLMKFPEYAALRTPKTYGKDEKTEPGGGVDDDKDGRTALELIEAGYAQMRSALVSELLERIKSKPPVFFERLVVDLLLKMDYGAGQPDAGLTIGKPGDEGIDGIIKEDKLGLEAIYVQAKRWDTTVGRPDIQRFAGALQGQKSRKGVFITTSTFSGEARAYAAQIQSSIVLVDGQQLATLLIDHGVAVATQSTYEVKRLDSDYFDAE